MQIKLGQRCPANISAQKGATLIIVIVVLLALTLAGLAATDSGNLQRIMVRNNQFRLEAFNTSQAEIESQIEHYRDVSDQPIFNAIDAANRVFNDGTTATLEFRDPIASYDKVVGLDKTSGCLIVGNTLGKYECNLMEIDSKAKYSGSNIYSDQRQTFSFITLK